MSAAESDTLVPTYRPRRLSTRFLRSELRLVFTRRRNLAALVVLAAVPVFIAVAVKVSSPSSGGDGPEFFSSITSNGLFVALSALTVELGLFLPLAVATVMGDSVAGEAQGGTLRYLLTVPVDRTRLLLVKLAAGLVFTLASTLVVAVTGVVVGVLLFGGGDLTLLSGTQIGFGAGLLRVLAAAAYLALSLGALTAVGLFISTLTEQPIGATVAIVLFSSASYILDAIPQVSWLHPYLLTHHWLAFAGLLRAPVDWSGMLTGLYVAAAYVVVFGLAAWARFGHKDITS